MPRDQSRRRFLGTLASLGAAGLAGCRSTDGVLGGPRSGTGSTPRTGTLGVDGNRSSGDRDEAVPSGAAADVHDAVAPSVCNVSIYDGSGGSAQGSAFVYDDDHLVTNQHVVASADSVYVRFGATGWREASVVASDVYSDLAVLDGPSVPDGAAPLPFVDDEAEVGTRVVAIGNPFGFAGSVSAGIVSGVDRTLDAANGFSIPDAVQTDAAVNPGNSGGPLVSYDGSVVGVVNAGGGDDIGFAISAALTGRVVPALLSRGAYEHPYVGVGLRSVTPPIAEANDLTVAGGVYIDQVIDGGPAEGVLRGSTGRRTVDGVTAPTGGDVVLAVAGHPTPDRQSLATVLALRTEAGETVPVRLRRDGAERTASLTLGARPDPQNPPTA